MSPDESIFHRMGEDYNKDNLKFVSPDGHSEAVFRPDGTPVTNPVNTGTYNYSSPYENGGAGHILVDVAPYVLWGNSPDDPTTIWERISASYHGSTQGVSADPVFVESVERINRLIDDMTRTRNQLSDIVDQFDDYAEIRGWSKK